MKRYILLVIFIASIIGFWEQAIAEDWKEYRLTNVLNFSATLGKDNKVYMSWRDFDSIGLRWNFKYYKIIRSTDVSDPIYPEEWYIGTISESNITSYVDEYAKKWINFYRICAMTDSRDRYCSNVDSVTLSMVKSTYETIDDETKEKVDEVLKRFYKGFEKRHKNNKDRLLAINSLVSKLEDSRERYESLGAVIDYMIKMLERRKAIYWEGFSDFIEN